MVKKCPLLILANTEKPYTSPDVNCLETKCGWYDENDCSCAIKTISYMLGQIEKQIQRS